jgi:hypothetical protein
MGDAMMATIAAPAQPLRYADDRIAITPPAAWGAPRMIAFSNGEPGSPSLVVTYEHMREGEPLSQRLRAHVELFCKSNPGAEQGAVGHRQVGGRTALRQTLRWWGKGGPMEQTSLYIAPGPSDPTTLTILIYTAPHGTDPRMLERVLASVKFPERAAES